MAGRLGARRQIRKERPNGTGASIPQEDMNLCYPSELLKISSLKKKHYSETSLSDFHTESESFKCMPLLAFFSVENLKYVFASTIRIMSRISLLGCLLANPVLLTSSGRPGSRTAAFLEDSFAKSFCKGQTGIRQCDDKDVHMQHARKFSSRV
eukprot:283555-Amphidinium_carterae.1